MSDWFKLAVFFLVLGFAGCSDRESAEGATWKSGNTSARVYEAKSVSLDDATLKPTSSKHLKPHSKWTFKACEFPSDIQAYTRTGKAIGPQMFDDATGNTFWDYSNFVVTYQAGVFNNKTNKTVLVAGWCE